MPNPTATVYSDMDEILTKPPKRIVRYGNITFLFLLLILFAISFFVSYQDGVHTTAIINTQNVKQILSPGANAVVEKIYVTTDTLLHQGDTIMVLNNEALLAPITGKIICNRKLTKGSMLAANTPLFTMAALQNTFTAIIILPAAEANKIVLGQKVQITLDGNSQQNTEGEIISLPYKDSATQQMMVDAQIQVTQQNASNKMEVYIFNSRAKAYIFTGKKSISAAFLGM